MEKIVSAKKDIATLKDITIVRSAINRGWPTRQALRQILNFYNPIVRNTNHLYEYVRLADVDIDPAITTNRRRTVYSLEQGLEIIDNLKNMWQAGDERAGNMHDLGITTEGLNLTRAATRTIFLKKKA